MKVLLLLALVFATGRSGEVKTGASNGVLCEVCKIGVSFVDKLLKKNETVDRINSTLQKVCSYIPLFSSKCKKMVNKYLPLIIKFVAGMSAEDVCTDLHLCSSGSAISQAPPLVKELSAENGIGCEICELVVKEAGNLLKDSSTQEKIISGLKDVCDTLPSSDKSDCNQLVEEYAPQLFTVYDNVDATEMCPLLDCVAVMH